MTTISIYETVVSAARAGVIAVDPSEQEILNDILDPPRRRWWNRSAAVGFGFADVVHWVSPYAAAAAVWYARIWYDEGKSALDERTRKLARRVLRSTEEPDIKRLDRPHGAVVDAELLAEHEQAVIRYIVAMGLDDERARVVARAVVGTFMTTPPGSSDD